MKKKWTSISTLGVLTPLSTIASAIATNCSSDEIELIEHEPIVVSDHQIAPDQSVNSRLVAVQKLDVEQKLNKFSSNKGDLITNKINLNALQQKQSAAKNNNYRKTKTVVNVTLKDNKETKSIAIDNVACKAAINLNHNIFEEWKESDFAEKNIDQKISLLTNNCAGLNQTNLKKIKVGDENAISFGSIVSRIKTPSAAGNYQQRYSFNILVQREQLPNSTPVTN